MCRASVGWHPEKSTLFLCRASVGWHPEKLLKPFSFMKQYYVYILASKRNGTLYVGVTSDLIKRVWQHKSKLVEGFTKKYDVSKLVYYEVHLDIREAIKREKNIQAWKRAWKLRLIEEQNSEWEDLYEKITGCQPALA